MTKRFFFLMIAMMLLAALTCAQQSTAASTTKPPRLADGHPDLSGVWSYTIGLPPGGLKRDANGSVTVKAVDQSATRGPRTPVAGELPFTAKPSYKPEFAEKVKYLSDNESK